MIAHVRIAYRKCLQLLNSKCSMLKGLKFQLPTSASLTAFKLCFEPIFQLWLL